MKVDLSLKHLESFIAVAEDLHFGRAARRLYISQPPLTRQIKLLEKELGVILFKRSKRRVELTEAGEILLRKARELFSWLDRVVGEVQASSANKKEVLSIGFEGAAMYDVIPRSVKSYQEKYPEVTVTLHDLTRGEQFPALLQNRIAAGFVVGRIRDRRLRVEPVLREPITLALPANHRLARQNVISIKSLAAEQFLLCPRDHNPVMYDHLIEMFRRAGFVPNIVHQPAEMQLVLGFIAAGLGVAIVPAAVRKLRRPEVVYRAIKPAGASTELSLISLKTNDSLLVSRFVEVVKLIAKDD